MISWEWWNLHSGVWTRDPICYNTVNLKRIPGLQVAQMVKNLPAMWETQVRSLGREDPLEKGMLPTPVFLLGEFHGQRSLAGCSPWGRKELAMTEWLTLFCFLFNCLAVFCIFICKELFYIRLTCFMGRNEPLTLSFFQRTIWKVFEKIQTT